MRGKYRKKQGDQTEAEGRERSKQRGGGERGATEAAGEEDPGS